MSQMQDKKNSDQVPDHIITAHTIEAFSESEAYKEFRAEFSTLNSRANLSIIVHRLADYIRSNPHSGES